MSRVRIIVKDVAGNQAVQDVDFTLTSSGSVPPDLAATSFANASSYPFGTQGSLTDYDGNTDINLIPDPTGQFSDYVARMRYLRSSTAQSADVNRALKWQHPTGIGLGQNVYFAGDVLVPTPASNMMLAMRKLIYIQRLRDFNSFYVLKAEGNELKSEFTGSKLFRCGAGSFPFDRRMRLKVQLKMNSAVGVADGIVRVWKDGTILIDKPNQILLNSTEPFYVFLFGMQCEHQLNDLSVLFDEYRYWDNLAISTQDIS